MTTETPTRPPLLPTEVRSVIDAGRALERQVERATAPVQWATLLTLDAIARTPGSTATPLAAQLGYTRQTLSAVLGRMHRDGLVERQVDEKNASIVRYWLTVDGVQLLEDCEAKLAKMALP